MFKITDIGATRTFQKNKNQTGPVDNKYCCQHIDMCNKSEAMKRNSNIGVVIILNAETLSLISQANAPSTFASTIVRWPYTAVVYFFLGLR